MALQVAILEDNVARVAEMRACLDEVLPGVPVVFFENATEMIAWLERHLREVVLISLDHDLPFFDPSGKPIDCGDGRMVAEFLAALSPTCPVIVHSSNNNCAPGMFFSLEESGWPVTRVVPYDDLTWVPAAWRPQIQQLKRSGWIFE